jgi:hypothetical protein
VVQLLVQPGHVGHPPYRVEAGLADLLHRDVDVGQGARRLGRVERVFDELAHGGVEALAGLW